MKYFFFIILFIIKMDHLLGNDLEFYYIGKKNWVDITSLCNLDNKIFSIEKGNILFSTNLENGIKIKHGSLNLLDELEIYCVKNKIYAVNIQGDLYLIDPQTAKVEELKKQFLFGALKITSSTKNLFMIDALGNIYKIDLNNFQKQKLKTSRTFSNTLYFFVNPLEDKMIVLDILGIIYVINLDDTIKEIKIDQANFLLTTEHALWMNNNLFIIDITGSLYKVDIESKKWQLLGNIGQFKRIEYFFIDNHNLYFINKNGDLFYLK